MFLFVKLKNKSGELINRSLHKGILVRTALLSWVLIVITLFIFILGIIPAQREALKERMKTEAKDIASSIGQVTATAIIDKDYGFTVDYCLKIIKQSNSILYIVITREDGFSLVQTKNGWQQETIKEDPYLPNTNEVTAKFIYSDLVKQNVFHYSYPFIYSGIVWGRINIGLSVKSFDQNMDNLYYRIIWLTILSIFVSFFISIYFAKKLTSPIRQLDIVAQKISDGELDVKVNIKSEDEIGRLAYSFNKMADSLKSSQDNLERKVEERTAEFERINKILQVQIKEKMQAENALTQYNIRLEALDKIYRGIISAKSVEDIIKEVLNHLKKLFKSNSKSSIALFDEKNNTAIIFSRKFVNNEDPISKVEIPLKENFDLELEKEIHIMDCKNTIVNNAFYNEIYFGDGIKVCLSVPLLMDGQLIGTITISSVEHDSFNEEHREILSVVANQLAIAIYHALLQVKIKEHAKNLQSSLSEKEVLLKEIHHRVKNNLQVISSLLYLNSKKTRDKETLEMFKDSQNRVKSIALVHERLYQSRDLGSINFEEYVRKLIIDLSRSYGVNQDIIKINIDINNIFISIDNAVPCGLIINELVSNSFKYAFPENTGKEKYINISFKRIGRKELLLIVSDNGIGINEELKERKKHSLGIQLVETLVEQLDGTLEIEPSSGTTFKIRYKEAIA